MVVAETSAEASTELTTAVPCDVGHTAELTATPDFVCDRPAEWTALMHDCHFGTPVTLCTPHLMAARRDPRPDQFIKSQCSSCGKVCVSMDEQVWNVRRL